MSDAYPPLRPRIEFTEALLPRVQGLTCGPNAWDIEVAEWIARPPGGDGAVDAIYAGVASVWLYVNEADEVVGFGSLGASRWRWPNPKKSDPVELQVVPFFGVSERFHGQPPGDPAERYSSRIFESLLAIALDRVRGGGPNLLGLLVHPDNDRAVRFYRRFGFAEFAPTKSHKRMLIDLAAA